MATAYGSTVSGAWRAYMDYSVTSDSEKYTASITSAGMQSVNWGIEWDYAVYHSIGYNSNGAGETSIANKANQSFYSGYGETKRTSYNTGSKSFERTHSDYSVYIYSYIRSDSNYLPGSSQAEYAFTVKAKPSYAVTYNANGGSGAPGSQTKWYGEKLTLSSAKPTRTGYTFQGWATSSTGGVSYAPGASYASNAALALYAVWKINTWTVSYNANGGSGAPGSQTKTYGQALTLSSTKPTRTGYTFQGWGTSASDTTVDYAAGASYTGNAALALYAIWKINTWTVSYNANGGTGAPSAQTKTYNVTLTLSSTKPTRTGYTFLGWATSSNATSAAYAAGASYTANAGAALYAVWKVVAPAAPTACANTRNSDTKNTVTWTRGANADITYSSIKVERSIDGGSWSQIASVAGTSTSYSDTTTSANHSYRYRVRAYNSTGYSSYATSGYTYNTPAAPTAVAVARTGETTVSITVTNPAKTATALELQRSADASAWTTVQTATGTVTSLTDDPGGGTFYYRARNTRGTLVSAWSAASEAVVTICAPNAPSLVEPVSGITVPTANETIAFSWLHSPVDGSAQTGAELQHSTDDGARWTTVAIAGGSQTFEMDNAFSANVTVTWRVRTKGAHADFGPWSSTRILYMRQAPVVAFDEPPDAFVVENMPIRIALDYEDASGSLAQATLAILGDGGTVWSRDLGTSTELVIQAADFLPVNGREYTLRVDVRSTSTLSSSAIRDVTVSFVPPMKGYLEIEPDEETGYASVLVSVEQDEELVEVEHMSVYRVVDGTRILLGENLPPGTALMDKYAPINKPYTMEVVSFAASGVYSTAVYETELSTPWSFFYWGDAGVARLRWDPQATRKIARPSRRRVYYAGRRYPVSYDSAHVSDERTVSGLLMEQSEAEAFARMVEEGGRCVYKSGDGDVIHTDAEATLTPELTVQSYYGRVALNLVRIEGEAL